MNYKKLGASWPESVVTPVLSRECLPDTVAFSLCHIGGSALVGNGTVSQCAVAFKSASLCAPLLGARCKNSEKQPKTLVTRRKEGLLAG